MALFVAARTLRTDTRHWWTHTRHGSLLWWCYQSARRAFQYASPVVWRPNPRLLFCGMVGFLWDRERIPVEEVMRCLEDYESRLRWRLHSDQASIASSTTGAQKVGGPVVGVCQSGKDPCSHSNVASSISSPCDAHLSNDEASMDTEGEEPRVAQSQCGEKNDLGTGAFDSDDGLGGLGTQPEDSGEGRDLRTNGIGVLDNEDSLAEALSSHECGSSCYICEDVEVSKEQLLRTYEERLGTTSAGQIVSVKGASAPNDDANLAMAEGGGTDAIAELATPSVAMDTTDDTLDTMIPSERSRDERGEEQSLLVEQKDPLSGWALMAEEENCKVYKMPHGETGLNKYKVIGTYDDITAKDFLDIQVDHDARKEWDAYVVKLDTVDKDPASGCEVIHWIMKYPFPMQNREYLYVRKFWVSRTENAIVLINRSVTHPSIPESRRYVRVHRYFSEMVIKPHTFIDELGFSFELTYFDDPQSYLPSSCVNWVTTTAMPDFLNQIHNAALHRIAADDAKKHGIGA
eukprot:Em0003g1470a